MCELCKKEKRTPWLYEDEICWVAYCSSHPDKLICVSQRHTEKVSEEEEKHMRDVMEKIKPGIKLRGPASILSHFHLHEV